LLPYAVTIYRDDGRQCQRRADFPEKWEHSGNPCMTPAPDCFASFALKALVKILTFLLRHHKKRSDEAIQKKGCAELSWSVPTLRQTA